MEGARVERRGVKKDESDRNTRRGEIWFAYVAIQYIIGSGSGWGKCRENETCVNCKEVKGQKYVRNEGGKDKKRKERKLLRRPVLIFHYALKKTFFVLLSGRNR